MKHEEYIVPIVVEEQYGYKLKYHWYGTIRHKWLTNWIFMPQILYRRRREDGTYEEMIEGFLRYFYGKGEDEHESLKFNIWDDMFNSITSLNKMHPACNQFASGKQIDLLKAYIWQQARVAKCPIRSLKADITRRKKEIHRRQKAESANKRYQEQKKKDTDMNWEKLVI